MGAEQEFRHGVCRLYDLRASVEEQVPGRFSVCSEVFSSDLSIRLIHSLAQTHDHLKVGLFLFVSSRHT